jgi:hypothetical protein
MINRTIADLFDFVVRRMMLNRRDAESHSKKEFGPRMTRKGANKKINILLFLFAFFRVIRGQILFSPSASLRLCGENPFFQTNPI